MDLRPYPRDVERWRSAGGWDILIGCTPYRSPKFFVLNVRSSGGAESAMGNYIGSNVTYGEDLHNCTRGMCFLLFNFAHGKRSPSALRSIFNLIPSGKIIQPCTYWCGPCGGVSCR